ncbi:hypothetical protein ACHHYP_16303 [Achlya hypogyna]|uniref:LicD/FKTN/FKRP nucleotidyltransferase domain-containing protein n=1 Tax=Achlya hypogyna TaxID=1202772 RepID=A0A1V9Y961_ACHHY|nr:hypothetical protein ACHHYP_16303 [Achlya hypogyna]
MMTLGLMTLATLQRGIITWPQEKPKRTLAPGCIELPDHHLELEFVKDDVCWTRPQVQAMLRNLTRTFIEILETHDIEYWLDSGTLLGAVRNQGVIPHDYDADFALTKASMDKLRTTAIKLPEHYVLWLLHSPIHPWSYRDEALPGRWIDTRSGLYIDLFEFFPHANVSRTYTEKLPLADLKDASLKKGIVTHVAPNITEDSTDVIVSVTYTRVQDMMAPLKSVCWVFCVECHEHAYFQIPTAWIYPLQKCKFEGIMANCPANLHMYLRTLYGPNYMVPDV